MATQEKGKPGRPKKSEPLFDQKKGWALAEEEGMKFITQEGALFSYAEPIGPYIEELGSRPLVPAPKFMMWAKEWELQKRQKQYNDMRVRVFAINQQMNDLEKELKAEGVLDDTS